MSSHHLGINMGHDRSVAVVKDGEIVVAIEQERLDRIKHSVGFMLQAPDAMGQIQVPGESIAYCLDHLGLPLGEMATITANMPGRVARGRGGSLERGSQPLSVPETRPRTRS
jgi:carbamoyltransferase